MGAQTFYDEAAGSSATEAFANARERALYEYGHRGYTGTIAEKHDFEMIKDSGTEVITRLREQIEHGEERLYEWEKPYWPQTRERLVKQVQQLEAKSSPAAIADALVSVSDPRISDKWGPAGCIKLGPSRYLFFGWASS